MPPLQRGPIRRQWWRDIFEPGARGGRADGALGFAAQLHRALGSLVHVDFYILGDLVEKLMQADEVRAFDIPVRLFGLKLEINCIGQRLAPGLLCQHAQRVVLKAGADVNATNEAGATPLHYAVGSEYVLQLLLKTASNPISIGSKTR